MFPSQASTVGITTTVVVIGEMISMVCLTATSPMVTVGKGGTTKLS